MLIIPPTGFQRPAKGANIKAHPYCRWQRGGYQKDDFNEIRTLR